MRKIMIIFIMLMLFSSTLLFAEYLENLTAEEKEAVLEFSMSVDQEITETNFEAVEGVRYDIVLKTPHYIVIKIGEYYYIIDTTEA
jgi:type VI protein secretion system component VasK